MSMRVTLARAALQRTPARTALAIAGIAVAAALLLDMVMLATGMSDSFRSLLLAHGYQLRIAPKGTLPFDTEATIDGAHVIVAKLRASPLISAVSPVLASTLTIEGGRIPSSFVIGIEPDVQGDYQIERGMDIRTRTLPIGSSSVADTISTSRGAPRALATTDLPRAVASATFLERSGFAVGDTVTVAAGVSAQLRTSAQRERIVIAGLARFFYVPAETPVLAIHIDQLRTLLGRPFHDRLSLAMAGVVQDDSASVERARAWIAEAVPTVTSISTDTAIRQVEERLSYFRQLAFVLGAISLGIGFLLVSTLVTLSVNERRGEIAVMRAIGTLRHRIMLQVVIESLMLSGVGIMGGLLLGLVTARWLNAILRDFPGLPASFDFFVWSAGAAWRSLALLLVSGALAGIIPAWRAASIPIVRALREEAVG